MRHALRSSLLILAAFGSTVEIRAGEPVSTIPPELILERFAVNKGGDLLLVPVKIAGKERLFLVDTGCTKTIVDKAILLGEPRESLKAEASQGEITVKVYASPDGSVGRLPLRVDSVVGVDLDSVREASGYPIDGVLGMDFLARYVVQVNFDRGELLILKRSPKSAGDGMPFNRDLGNTPVVDVWLSRDKKIRFIVDTGHDGRVCGSMKSLVIRPMVKGGDFHEVGSTLMASIEGTHTSAVLQGKRLALGGISVDRPIFLESPTTNSLGLGFWSRFIVTFDFPGDKIHLQKGAGYDRLDLWDLSGLHLIKRDGAVVIDSVDKGSPGASAGIQAGDVLLTLGDKRADETPLLEMQTALCHEGPLACSVRRGSEERHLTLSLPR